MNKWMIVALVLIGCGMVLFFIGMFYIDFDFSKLAAPTTTNNYSITDQFSSISVNSHVADVYFSVSQDETCQIQVLESEALPVKVTVEDGVLTIKQENHRKWYDYIGIFTQTKVTVILPQTQYDKLTVHSDTGKVVIGSKLTFRDVAVQGSTGSVSIACSVTDSLSVRNSTGKVTLTSVSCGAIDALTSTGHLTIENCTAESLDAEASTGNIQLINTVVSGKLTARADTGDITLDRCDADSLKLNTSTGDVSGTLLTEKIVFAETDTGHVSVPHSTNGGRCDISTDTGNITIDFS